MPTAVMCNHETLYLDGEVFSDCEFRDCRMIYSGGEAPVFDNDQDVEALAERVAVRLAERPHDAVPAPGYVLAGHGLYAWGRDAKDAWRHLEALETLFQQILASRSYRP